MTTLLPCAPAFSPLSIKSYLLGSSSHQDSINYHCLHAILCPPQARLHFVLTRFVDVVIPNLRKIFAEIRRRSDADHHYAILIQLGSWDVGQHMFKDVVHNVVIPKFQEAALRELYIRGNFSNVKVMVMSAPALPDRDPQGGHLVQRNNWIGATFAGCTLRRHMEELKVAFLDEFSFNLPLFWYVGSWPRTKNNHHFAVWNPAGKYCDGHVGRAFIQLMAAKLCPEVDMY